MLQIHNLTRHFGGLVAVNNVSLRVNKGEIFGVIGPNGAGKTTFFNLLSGIFPCSSGEIIFKGIKTNNLPPHKVARLGIGRTFQIVRPFGDLTVIDNVLVGIGANFCGNVFSALKQSGRKRYHDQAQELLKRTDLQGYAHELAGNLPLGLLRRLEIARAIAIKPDLILLDESFSGLSHREALSLSQLVRSLKADGLTVILIEHNMQITMSLCERLAVLDGGVKIADGTPDEIRNHERVIAAYLGTEDHA
jgi:branched-chain amino acid transport system ATP-binding protein